MPHGRAYARLSDLNHAFIATKRAKLNLMALSSQIMRAGSAMDLSDVVMATSSAFGVGYDTHDSMLAESSTGMWRWAHPGKYGPFTRRYVCLNTTAAIGI